MKVALLGPIAWRTPPRSYGPWELITGLLAEGLVEQGVQVTLFATLDSQTRAELDGVCPTGYNEAPGLDGRVWEAMHVARVVARSAEFDLVHNHLDWLPLAFSTHFAAPLLTTIHGFSGPGILPAYRSARSAYVSISDADRAPELTYCATVHHGIDLDGIAFGATAEDYLVALGRIHPDKGTATAIEIARRAGRPLIIAGPVHDQAYFDELVAPHIDDDGVHYLGSISPQQRSAVLSSAYALLHPVGFDEPFGLSVVEAMAAGTPVIAFPRGAMPEVIDPGLTGFLVRDIAEAVAAVEAVGTLSRIEIRRAAERRFDARRMVRDYVAVYASLLR